jgi:hypothetical protein
MSSDSSLFEHLGGVQAMVDNEKCNDGDPLVATVLIFGGKDELIAGYLRLDLSRGPS